MSSRAESLSRVSVKQFSFFMKSIAENELWEEVEFYLDQNGVVDIVVSAAPVLAVQELLQQKIQSGETLSPRGRRVALCHCGVGSPGPPGGPPRFPPGPGGGGPPDGGGPPPGPPPEGGGPPPGPPPETPQ